MNELTTQLETGVELVNVERVFKSKKLLTQTQAIEKLMLQTKKNMFEIASRLLVIDNEKLYEADGFTDVFEYAETVLHYKKTMVYKMIQTASNFITTVDGRTYTSIFYSDGATADYTVSQLMELNTLGVDTAKELDSCKVITNSMTTKELRTAIKEYKDDLKKSEDSDGSDDSNGSDSSDSGSDGSEDAVNATVNEYDLMMSRFKDIGQALKDIIDDCELHKYVCMTPDLMIRLRRDADFYVGLKLKHKSKK